MAKVTACNYSRRGQVDRRTQNVCHTHSTRLFLSSEMEPALSYFTGAVAFHASIVENGGPTLLETFITQTLI
jgi:hypothetical protein